MRYTFGDWELDLQLYELRDAGSPVKLEPQVFNVLVYLLQHRDRVVSRQELLEKLWADQFIGESAIERCVMAARKAVGDSGNAQRVIKTLHGRGYRFVAPVWEPESPSGDAGVSVASPSLSLWQKPLLPEAEPLQGDSTVQACPACHQVYDTPLEPRPVPKSTEMPQTLWNVLDGERKPVTILCCALSIPTALTGRMEPDTLHRLTQRFRAGALEEVERYGGTLPHIGETEILALFGAPVAYEDHAQRAVLAAIKLQQRLHQAPPSPETLTGPALSLRIGLHSGPVLVGRVGATQRLTYTAVGNTTRLARHLQDMAEPGTILLGETTRRLVQSMVDLKVVRPSAPSAPAGAATVYTVRGLVPPDKQATLAPMCLTQPFIGRDHELALLQALWEKARGGRGQVAGIVAEAGAGKSRLLYEFRQRLKAVPVTYLQGRCVSYGSIVPFLPVRDILWHACGLTKTDDVQAICAKVNRRLREVGLSPEQDAPYVFRLLLGAKRPEAMTNLDPEAIRTRTFTILQQLSLEASRQQPCLMIVENLHWIDATSEAYLASLVARLATTPLFLITTYRPGYCPPWSATSYATQLSLSPLSPQDSSQMAHAVLRETRLPAERLQRIVTQAAGNPFFLQELTRAALARQDGTSLSTLPDTVQALVMARIDQLPQVTKRLLEVAAVIGTDVPVSRLQAIGEWSEAQLHDSLTRLQEAEILHETRLLPDRVYAFKHPVVHEVLHESLGHERRQVLQDRLAAASTANASSQAIKRDVPFVYHDPSQHGTRPFAQLH